MPTNCNTHSQRSNLFLVRLWVEDAQGNNSDAQWRGRIQRVVNGETIEFQGWQGLVEHLSAMLSPGRASMSLEDADLPSTDTVQEEA